jgi:hypothetical protein
VLDRLTRETLLAQAQPCPPSAVSSGSHPRRRHLEAADLPAPPRSSRDSPRSFARRPSSAAISRSCDWVAAAPMSGRSLRRLDDPIRRIQLRPRQRADPDPFNPLATSAGGPGPDRPGASTPLRRSSACQMRGDALVAAGSAPPFLLAERESRPAGAPPPAATPSRAIPRDSGHAPGDLAGGRGARDPRPCGDSQTVLRGNTTFFLVRRPHLCPRAAWRRAVLPQS